MTKFQNNPQHLRVLANEMFATKLGLTLGLPMPTVQVIEVSEWLIERTPELRIQLAGTQIRVRNLADFARALVLDKWTSNCDGRQAVFFRKTPRSRRYTATFIDQGYCFNAGEWTFPDYPLRGVYANNCVYETVTGWEAFEPALTGAETMDAGSIWQCANAIPEEWYEGDRPRLERVVEELSNRRGIIRKLISEFRKSTRNPFPNWRDSHSFAVPLVATRDEAREIR